MIEAINALDISNDKNKCIALNSFKNIAWKNSYTYIQES